MKIQFTRLGLGIAFAVTSLTPMSASAFDWSVFHRGLERFDPFIPRQGDNPVVPIPRSLLREAPVLIRNERPVIVPVPRRGGDLPESEKWSQRRDDLRVNP